jgi:hypothetical protein
MKEFVLIFRMDALPEVGYSSEELEPMMKNWESWLENLVAKNILVSYGNRLGAESRIIKNGKVITDGPYAEIKEIIGGFNIIRANSIDEAAEIAKSCPLIGDSAIEVRNVFDMNRK